MGVITKLYKADKPESYELGKGEWFRIIKSDNYAVVKLADIWTVDTLTDFVRKALSVQGGITKHEARLTAENIFAWAGDDRLIMVPDTEDEKEVLKKFGAVKRHKKTGDRWTIYGAAMLPSMLSADERDENERLVAEVYTDTIQMMDESVQKILTLRSGSR